MQKAVTIADHGAGNLASVVRAFEHLGATVSVLSDPAQLADADRLVLPGQGAFRDCIGRLNSSGLSDAVRAHIATGRPYLGICVGLQLLFERGLEHGSHAGLGVLKGVCVPLPRTVGLKIPHMGWNQVERAGGRSHPWLDSIADGSWYYFVHSYHVVPTGDVAVAHTGYGQNFVSAVAQDNICAVQFHPEKSQRAGLALLTRFMEI